MFTGSVQSTIIERVCWFSIHRGRFLIHLPSFKLHATWWCKFETKIPARYNLAQSSNHTGFRFCPLLGHLSGTDIGLDACVGADVDVSIGVAARPWPWPDGHRYLPFLSYLSLRPSATLGVFLNSISARPRSSWLLNFLSSIFMRPTAFLA